VQVMSLLLGGPVSFGEYSAAIMVVSNRDLLHGHASGF
jgi:hypothetical protein